MRQLYKERFEDILDLTKDIIIKLKEKDIYFTFAYPCEIRCYKHNILIWQYFSFDNDILIEKGKECIKFFSEKGYIPNVF
jgi:hypothetical protein